MLINQNKPNNMAKKATSKPAAKCGNGKMHGKIHEKMEKGKGMKKDRS